MNSGRLEKEALEKTTSAIKEFIGNSLSMLRGTINKYWYERSRQIPHPEMVCAEINEIILKKLDLFIKNEFILGSFAAEFAHYEERLKTRFKNRDPLFSDYKAQFFLKSTPYYLMKTYPLDFIVFNQFNQLLEKLNQCRHPSAKGRLREIIHIMQEITDQNNSLDTCLSSLQEIIPHLATLDLNYLQQSMKNEVALFQQQYQHEKTIHHSNFYLKFNKFLSTLHSDIKTKYEASKKLNRAEQERSSAKTITQSLPIILKPEKEQDSSLNAKLDQAIDNIIYSASNFAERTLNFFNRPSISQPSRSPTSTQHPNKRIPIGQS